MRESELSSGWTFFYKFVFPAVWIPGFGLGTVLLWLVGFHDRNNASPPPELKFQSLGMWFVGAAFILWVASGLKRVRIDGQHLFVSNYFREIRLPFSSVIDVRQNRWLTPRQVTIYFRIATELGDRATFIPKARFRIHFWRIDPVVDELRRLAGLLPNG
jgi:hypothetical protein